MTARRWARFPCTSKPRSCEATRARRGPMNAETLELPIRDTRIAELSVKQVLPTPAWFLAARGDELPRGAPLARAVNGVPVVLSRDPTGRAAALEGRCPHKNVALSPGRVQGDTLPSWYHGWRFNRIRAVLDGPGPRPR